MRRIDPALLEEHRDLLARERDRLLRTARYRAGAAVLAWLHRPWRVVALVREVVSILRGGPVRMPPLVLRVRPADGPVDEERRRRLVEEAGRLWTEVRAILRSREFLLGNELVALPSAPWRIVQLPGWLRRGDEPPPPPAARADPVPLRAPPGPPPLRCHGPAWFERLLGAGDVDAERADATLVCTAAGPPPPVRGRYACWVVEREPSPAWEDTLRGAEAVFAADPDTREALATRLGREVRPLPPAVQPRLWSPVGWWGAGRAPEADDLPPDWSLLRRVARGQDLEPREAERLGRILGAPLPDPRPPAWAEDGAAWPRLARLRRVVREETLAHRLAAVARALGIAHDVHEPLASVVLCTNRPRFLERILGHVARQTYPRLELVLMLHGDAVDRAAAARRAEELGLDATVLSAPASLTLGECLQVACDRARGELVLRIDDDDWYGPRYAEDIVVAFACEEAGDLLTKASTPIGFAATGRLLTRPVELEYRYVQGGWGGGRMAFRREVLEEVRWRKAPRGEDTLFFQDCLARALPILSPDRFHHVQLRRDPGAHTWKVPASHFERHDACTPLPEAARVEDFQP